MRKSREIVIKTIQIKGEKLSKAVKFEIIITKLGTTWYLVRQRELNYEQTFLYYPLSEVIKKVRRDLYTILININKD